MAKLTGCEVRSESFAQHNVLEIALRFNDIDLRDTAEALCDEIASYGISSGKQIRDGEKLAWASGVLRFVRDDDLLVGSALNVKDDCFESTADIVLRSWRDQTNLCVLNGSRYVPPKLDDYVVATNGLAGRGGRVTHGIRFPYNSPNSGWWLYGDDFNGDVSSMRRVHLGDVLQRSVINTAVLGLEPGFVFRNQPFLVERDEEIARREPI